MEELWRQQPIAIAPSQLMITMLGLAVMCVLFLWVWRSGRRKNDETVVTHSQLVELKQHVATAAVSRQPQHQLAPSSRRQNPKRGRDQQRKVDQSNTKHGVAVEEDEAATSPKIRQATLGDQVAWKEEQSSQEQFGFSIYGHTSSDYGCCSDKPSTTSKAISIVPTGFNAIQGVSEIEGKPASQAARDLLLRLSREFEPVASARGWTVQNLVELCICNDTHPANTAGYCVSPGDARIAKSIHIRLRSSCQSGHFVPYQDLVKIMAHELAHIVIHPHNDAFFRLMAEIEDEYALCLVGHGSASAGVGNNSFFLTAGRRLGTANSAQFSPVLGSRELKAAVANAAMKRSEASQLRQAEEEQHKKTS